MRYRIVEASCTYELMESVNRYLKDGWTIHGSIFAFNTKYNSDSYIQTLVRYDTEKEEDLSSM